MTKIPCDIHFRSNIAWAGTLGSTKHLGIDFHVACCAHKTSLTGTSMGAPWPPDLQNDRFECPERPLAFGRPEKAYWPWVAALLLAESYTMLPLWASSPPHCSHVWATVKACRLRVTAHHNRASFCMQYNSSSVPCPLPTTTKIFHSFRNLICNQHSSRHVFQLLLQSGPRLLRLFVEPPSYPPQSVPHVCLGRCLLHNRPVLARGPVLGNVRD
jgi:hypothetical protein